MQKMFKGLDLQSKTVQLLPISVLVPPVVRKVRRGSRRKKKGGKKGKGKEVIRLGLRSVAGGGDPPKRKYQGEEEETEEEGESSDEDAAGEDSSEEEEEDWARFDGEIMKAIADFLRPASLTASDFIVLR